MHPADQVPQFGQRLLGLLVRLADDGGGGLRVGLELGPGPAELHGQGDQPLLGAVVQVTLDPAAFCLGGVDTRARLVSSSPILALSAAWPCGPRNHRAAAASVTASNRVSAAAAASSASPAAAAAVRAAGPCTMKPPR